jgi:PAS domain S-box-containing protein
MWRRRGLDRPRPGSADVIERPSDEQRPHLLVDRRDTRMAIEATLLPPLFDARGVAIVATDVSGRVTAMSPPAEDLLGFTEADLTGAPLHDRLRSREPDGSPAPVDDCDMIQAIRDARSAAGEGAAFARKDGTIVHVAWAVAPIVIAGERTGAIVVFNDVDRPAGSRARARLDALGGANVRLALLADASHALLSAPSLRAGLTQMARLLVPVAADWVVLDLLDEQTGVLERAALAHRDPVLHAQGEAQLGPLPRLRPRMTSCFARVLRGEPAVHLTAIPPVEHALDELDRARLDLFHQLGAAEAVTAPMRTRVRTVGAITLVRSHPDQPYEPADLTFVTELATRAAFAAENAVLLERSELRAESLQRALLPDVPAAIGDARLAHLYRPADDVAQVGGDWYDAFSLKDDSIALVIGDVAGHDMHAAGRMGAIRHKLRAIASDRVAPPSEVLRRLDAVIRRLAPGDLVTMIYARLIPPQDADAPWTLEWSSAGHPPPLLLSPGAAPTLLPTDPDPPIGVVDLPRTDQRLNLPRSATIVLFTDGLIERAGESLDRGLFRVVQQAAAVEPPDGDGRDVDALPDRLLDVLQGPAEDDVAVLAVHVPS